MRTRLGGYAFLIFASTQTACSTDAVGPSMIQPASETAGMAPAVGLDQVTAATGCAVVARAADGSISTAVLARSQIAPLLGRLDVVPARLVAGKARPQSLQIVSAMLRPRGEQRDYTVNCLVSRTKSYGEYAELLRSSEGNAIWQSASRLLRPHSTQGAGNDVRLASALLLAPIHREVQPVVTSPNPQTVGSFGFNKAPPRQVARVYDCGVDAGVSCDPQQLPTVTVTATPGGGGPIIIDLTDLAYKARQFPDYADYIVEYYAAKECQNQNDTYVAMGDAIQSLEQAESDMQAATAAVGDYGCEYTLTGGGAVYCLDLFIMTERAGFLIGDDRRFDPYAPYKASRAQIYFNPDECAAYYVVNTTRAIIDWRNAPPDTVTDAPNALSWVSAVRGINGDCNIKWKLWAGWCTHQQAGSWVLFCPAIDGSVTLHRLPSGAYSGSLSEDPFPSRGLYQWDGGAWRTISERQQSPIWGDLFWARQRKERLILERSQVMTGGCEPY